MRFHPDGTPEKVEAAFSPPSRSLPSPREEARLDALLEHFLRATGGTLWPAKYAEVDAAESALGVRFPLAYYRFLLLAGGPSKGSAWRGLWRIDELVSLNCSLPVFRWFGGLVGVGNEGFLVYALDYRAGAEEPPLVSVGLSSSDADDVTPLADRFEDWLRETLPG